MSMENVLRDQTIFHEKSGMVLQWQNDVNCYEPIAYNAYYDEDEELCGTDIIEGGLLYNYIRYIRFSSMKIDKRTGATKPGMLDVYQWHISFSVLNCIRHFKSLHFLSAISRQAGKTYVIRKILAYALVFVPNYVEIDHERYYMTFVSVKRDLLIDQIRKLQPEVDKSIELFNMIYPQAKIITSEEDKNLKSTEVKKEYDRMINGKQIPYAGLDGLSAGANVNAG